MNQTKANSVLLQKRSLPACIARDPRYRRTQETSGAASGTAQLDGAVMPAAPAWNPTLEKIPTRTPTMPHRNEERLPTHPVSR